MSKHNPFKRLLAMVLSACLVLGMTPAAAAAEIQPDETGGEIIAFEALSEETVNREVPLGTSLEDLALPGTLNATVRVAVESGEDEPEQDSGEARFEDKDISAPVTWNCESGYESGTAGTYTFTAEVTEDSYTVSAALPAITVTVQEEALPTGGEITAFAELSDGIAEQAVPIGTQRSVLALPETLAATVDGEEVQVPVTWEPTPEYAPGGEDEEPGEYLFTPQFGEGYTLAEGVSAPEITVITQAELVTLRGTGELSWETLQTVLNQAETSAVIDLSGLSTPADSTVYTFMVDDGKTLTLKGSGTQIENIAFVFGSNNNITLDNLNIKSADNHADSSDTNKNGYSPLHFTGAANTLVLMGNNTITSGQTTKTTVGTAQYGAAVGVPQGSELTIQGIGTLIATAGRCGSGIGGGNSTAGGSIIIDSGTVVAKGDTYSSGSNGAGIGGGSSGNGGSIIINGGNITAVGGHISAGIGGGGAGGSGGSIIINGGTVVAKGLESGNSGAGIGGGLIGAGGTITINGGTVTATGSRCGAGIGGGLNGDGGTITISGGTVTATGGPHDDVSGSGGAGIGGGGGGDGGTITISGGTVTATGANGRSSSNIGSGAGIGGGGKDGDDAGNGGNITITGGSVKATGGNNGAENIGKGEGGTDGTLTDGNNIPVYLNTLTITGKDNTAISAASYGTSGSYGTNDVKTDADGKLYFYLPVSTEKEPVTVTADNTEYIAEYVRAENHDNAANMGLSLYDAEISITGSLQYTGAALEPEIIVTLGTATLGKGTDYTVSYEGNRTAAGDSGKVVITGAGNYAGKAEKAFTVAKKAITITPNSGQSKKYGETDPEFTYTADPGLIDSDSFTGALSRTSGEMVGTYPISLGTLSAGDNYVLSLAAETVYFTIEKCDVAAPVAPTLASKTHDTITLTEISGAEYRMGTNGAWQESNVFTGLEPNTAYTFYARYAATDTQNTSPASAASESITTDKAPQTAPPPPVFYSKSAVHVTVTRPDVDTSKKLQVRKDFVDDWGAFDSDWSFWQLTPNTEYRFYLRYAATDDSEASPASEPLIVTTDKATLTGSVSITGTFKYGETLTADTVNMATNVTRYYDSVEQTYKSYLDFGTLFYQWQRNGSDISGATGSSYTLVEEDIGSTISVVVSSDNCTGSVTSSATPAVEKADGPAAPSSVNGSYAGDGTDFTYTVTSISGAEYKMDEGQWQDSNVFAGIVPESAHTFYVRMKGSETRKEGTEGNTGVVTFAKLNDRLAPALAYTISGSFPKTVTITAVNGAEYKFGNNDWSNTNTYTSSAAENITLSIRLKETGTHNASAASSETVNTANQSQAAPAAFTLTYADVNEASYTVTIPATVGAEYSFDGENWSGVNTKSGLQPGEMVTGYKRMAAKEGFNASSAVSSSVTLPLFQVKTPAASPNGGTFTGNQSVSLSSATADAKIYYTTDGTTPTIGSTLYTTAINLTATTTLKVIAVKNGMTDSFLLTVTFTKKSGSGGGNSGSSGGSSSSGSSATNTPPGKTPNQPVTAAAPVTATAGQNGSASASIPEKSVTDAIAKAQADAKAQGKTANGTTVALNVTMPKGATSLTANLTRNSLNSLVSAGVTSLELNGSPVTVSFDAKALAEIQKQSSGNISITIAPNAGLSAAAKGMIGTRPVYDLTVSYIKGGKNATVSSFGGGTATVSVPYTPAKGEAVGGLYAVYVDAKGNATRIAGSAYDANSGCVMFTTTHFSLYGIGYTAPSVKFTDITNHWAKESIDYVIGRGLLSGTSETTFAPNTAMTRGMLVTALGRLANVDTKAYTTNSFTDVTADSAFRPYIEWAYKKGIVQGTGNGMFEPNRAITREEIAVIFSNYAKATGYTLPVTRTATTYVDASSIGSTYKTAVTAMQQAGIMMGGTGGKFNPKSSATRAEVSSMLHRYIKLTIDPATAQGWAKNDAGQYMYYKDGKALTGTQTIDSVKYFFNADGTLKTGWVKDDAGNWRFYSGNTMLVGFWDLGANGNNKTYYFTKDGIMVSGKWLEIDGKWYYFNADGSLAKSTKIDGHEVGTDGARKA